MLKSADNGRLLSRKSELASGPPRTCRELARGRYAMPRVPLGQRESVVELKGSCRAGGSVDLSLMMHEARAVFSDFGGHREAGGFSTTLEKVHLLEQELERAYEKVRINTEISEPQYIVDARLSPEEVNWDLWRDISKWRRSSWNRSRCFCLKGLCRARLSNLKRKTASQTHF